MFWMWSIYARACSVESDKGTVPDLSGSRSRALNRSMPIPGMGRRGWTLSDVGVRRAVQIKMLNLSIFKILNLSILAALSGPRLSRGQLRIIS